MTATCPLGGLLTRQPEGRRSKSEAEEKAKEAARQRRSEADEARREHEASEREFAAQMASQRRELNAEIVLTQMRGCRLRLLGVCSDLAADVEGALHTLCERMLGGLYDATAAISRHPTRQLLQLILLGS